MLKESSGNRYWTKGGWLVLWGIIASAFWAAHVLAQPPLVPGREPLTDIHNIKTLRAQFNHDAGKIRLILLFVPT